jgi:pimeloyl-ACP methyl ester carboxylesterase
VIRGVALAALVSALTAAPAWPQTPPRVVDLPTRPGVTQRVLVLAPVQPRAAVVLFAGSHGGLQLSTDGGFGWGKGNFLIRSRELFAEQGLLVAVVDAPSDRQTEPFLGGFRQTPGHVTDAKAVIAWLKQRAPVPVWLVGTSRGTQSAAFIATQASPASGGPDGLVLTSSILRDPRGRPVPDMPLDRVTVPVLVVHHRQDGCRLCLFADVPRLMAGLSASPRAELLAFEGGTSRGDPCEAFAHHGYNGLEREVVAKIAGWILAPVRGQRGSR